MNTIIKCPQNKCIYNHFDGCRPCKQCNCKPNYIDEKCDICWNCSNDLGILRWDDDEQELNDEEKELLKERIKSIKKPIVISTPMGDIK